MADEQLHYIYVSLPGGQVHGCTAILCSIANGLSMPSIHAWVQPLKCRQGCIYCMPEALSQTACIDGHFFLFQVPWVFHGPIADVPGQQSTSAKTDAKI